MLKTLEWDSNFLSKNVGLLDLSDGEFLFHADIKFYDLLYIFSPSALSFPEGFTNSFTVQLVDEKITFRKIVNKYNPPDPSIDSFPADYIPDAQFEELAIESGLYSRFNVDKKFPTEKFRDLYKIWLHRSVSRILADEVLIWKTKDIVAGFITVKMRKDFAEIGLIAVDHRFRGQGIAGKLMAAADYTVMKNGSCNEIRVVTQATNKPACNLYSKMGYQIIARKFVYHCWKK